MNLKTKVEGSFESCKDKDLKEMALWITGHYHWRDGKKYNDGSVGTINISPKEFLDLIVGISGGIEDEDKDMEGVRQELPRDEGLSNRDSVRDVPGDNGGS